MSQRVWHDKDPSLFKANLTKDEISQNLFSVLNTFNIPKNQNQFEIL
jgi:hypothetical protein